MGKLPNDWGCTQLSDLMVVTCGSCGALTIYLPLIVTRCECRAAIVRRFLHVAVSIPVGMEEHGACAVVKSNRTPQKYPKSAESDLILYSIICLELV